MTFIILEKYLKHHLRYHLVMQMSDEQLENVVLGQTDPWREDSYHHSPYQLTLRALR